MAGFSEFTVMAIIDAQDKASRILDKVIGTVEQLGESMKKTSEDVKTASEAIDESLLQTASGADALSLANDRVAASEIKLTEATKAQANAERDLMGARMGLLGAGEEDLVAAEEKLALAERDTAKASAELEAAQKRVVEINKLQTASNEEVAASEETVAATSTGVAGVLVATAAGAAIAGGLAVKSAADFQSATAHLVTDAGESSNKINMVSKAMLDMSSQVGFSATELANSMYHIESAGFHAQKAIDILRVSAEGAKVGNADLDTVTKTLAGTMDAYGMKTLPEATSLMNQLIETTASGDLRMQDLTTSLGNVTPVAAKAGISFDQVGGAIATMTSQNMSAAQATQNLSHFIQSLEKPTSVQIQQMQALGLNSNDVSNSLAGPDGLVNTITMLTKAISDHTKNGGVFIQTLTDSKSAAQDANRMLQTMSPTLKDLSDKLANGSLNVKDYSKAIKEMDPVSAKQGAQFLSLQERMGAFNKLLASGSPEAETFNAAMSAMTGGQIGLRTALMLSADGGRYFSEASKTIADSAKEGGGQVKNWDTIQKTFNQKLSEAKAAFDELGIVIGQKILPYVEKFVEAIKPSVDWIIHNKEAMHGLAVVLGGALLGALIAVSAILFALAAPILLIGALVEGLRKAWDVLAKWFDNNKSVFVEAWNYVAKKFEEITKWIHDHVIVWLQMRFIELEKWWHDHSKELSEIWKILWTEITTYLKVAWDIIKAVLNGLLSVWNIIWGAIKDTFKMAWDTISDVLTFVLHFLENAIGLFLDVITGHWGQAWSDLKKLSKDAFDDTIKFIKDVTKDFDKLLVDAGKNIIKGLINGIKSAGSGVMNAVSDIANSISGFFPHSPAKHGPLSGGGSPELAGTKIGSMLAAGMHASVSTVTRASSALAGAASLSASSGFGAGGLSATGAGGGGNVVIIDVRGSQLMSDRDMDVFVDKVGRRIATRILPAGGVRIRA